MKKHFTAHVIFAATALASQQVWALGFGRAVSDAVLGQAFTFTVPISVDPGERFGLDCMSTQVYYGESQLLPNAIRTDLQRGTADNTWIVKITASVPVEEPIVEVAVSAGCERRFTRRFSIFADPPTLGTDGGPVAGGGARARRRRRRPRDRVERDGARDGARSSARPLRRIATPAARQRPPARLAQGADDGPGQRTQCTAGRGAVRAPRRRCRERPQAGAPGRAAAPRTTARLVLDPGVPHLKLDMEEPVIPPPSAASGATIGLSELDDPDARQLKALEHSIQAVKHDSQVQQRPGRRAEGPARRRAVAQRLAAVAVRPAGRRPRRHRRAGVEAAPAEPHRAQRLVQPVPARAAAAAGAPPSRPSRRRRRRPAPAPPDLRDARARAGDARRRPRRDLPDDRRRRRPRPARRGRPVRHATARSPGDGRRDGAGGRAARAVGRGTARSRAAGRLLHRAGPGRRRRRPADVAPAQRRRPEPAAVHQAARDLQPPGRPQRLRTHPRALQPPLQRVRARLGHRPVRRPLAGRLSRHDRGARRRLAVADRRDGDPRRRCCSSATTPASCSTCRPIATCWCCTRWRATCGSTVAARAARRSTCCCRWTTPLQTAPMPIYPSAREVNDLALPLEDAGLDLHSPDVEGDTRAGMLTSFEMTGFDPGHGGGSVDLELPQGGEVHATLDELSLAPVAPTQPKSPRRLARRRHARLRAADQALRRQPRERLQAPQRLVQRRFLLGEAEADHAHVGRLLVERRHRDRGHADVGGQLFAERQVGLVRQRRVVDALEIRALARQQRQRRRREPGAEAVALGLVERRQRSASATGRPGTRRVPCCIGALTVNTLNWCTLRNSRINAAGAAT